MTKRSTNRKLSALALFGLVACSGGAADSGQSGGSGGSSGGDAASSEGSASGVIFKGPMVLGGAVMVTPLGPDLEPVGPTEAFEVSDYDGSFEVTLAHQGLVRIEATGQTHSEVAAETAEEEITIQALGEVGDRTVLQVNVVTDALSARIENDVRDGIPLTSAIEEAEEDFHAALGWDDRPEPENRHAIDPYDGGYEAAWLLAVSTVISEAMEIYEHANSEEGDEEAEAEAIAEFQEKVRNGFANEGSFSPAILDIMVEAERTADPDAAMLGLKAHNEDYGFDYPVPNIHEALDTDGDGVLNADDNCRYIPNPDQAPHASLDYGAACDLRATAITTGETFGCALIAEDGRLECWDVQGEPTGGAPPHPEVFSAHAFIPWAEIPDAPFTDGPFAQFEIRNTARLSVDDLGGGPPDGEGEAEERPESGEFPDAMLACARTEAGATTCWMPERPPLPIPGHLGTLSMSKDRICASEFSLPLTEAVTVPLGTVCFDMPEPDGPDAPILAFSLGETFTQLAVRADRGLCGLTEAGTVSCVDGNGFPEPPGLMGTYSSLAANISGTTELVCGISTSDGTLECTGTEISAWTDADALLSAPNLSELVVGRGVVCASDTDGKLLCANNQAGPPDEACPIYEDVPPFATNLTGEGCNVCGLDEEGFGMCWPRFWSQRRGEGDLYRP